MSNFLLTITIASHNFKITRISPRAKVVVENFARKYIQKGLVRIPGGRYVSEAIKVFAAATSDREEYRFHINQLKDFYDFIHFNHITENLYQVIILPIKPGKDIDVKIRPQWIPRDYQLPIIDYLIETNFDNIIESYPKRSKLVGIQTGRGKATHINSLVKTPTGWVRMGSIKVGDEITAKDGTITNVTGVYPQGKLQLYKITFADGRFVECCAEHLWKVYYINTSKHKRWRVVNTFEVLRLISMPNPRVYIDLIDVPDGIKTELPIDPYVLGVFLGDGHSGKHSVVITTPDYFIATEVSKLLPNYLLLRKHYRTDENKCSSYGIIQNGTMCKVDKSFTSELKKLDLYNKLSYDKFIPEIYLHASREQRLALLQGLLDTDGTITINPNGNKDGSISFCSSSIKLSKDVEYLVRSLGGIASISIRFPFFTYKGERKDGREAYNVNIRYKKPSELFRLPKKKDRTNDNNQYAKDLKLRVKSIVPSRIDYAQCISISHPDKLYITDDFIVTHNTSTSAFAMAELGKRVVIIIKPMFIEKWIDDLEKLFDIKKKDVMVVKGSDHLKGLFQLAKEDKLECKFIIISNKTIQNWFKLYEQYREGIKTLGYETLPETLFEDLDAGIRLIDEVHMDFHLCFKIDLYTNVARSISLSATLVSNDDFISRMHETMHPTKYRYAQQKLEQYINSYVVYYQFKDVSKIRTTEYGATSYSHNAFEKSIIKHYNTLINYYNLIHYVIQIGFEKNLRTKKKLLVFASTIEMCTLLSKYFAKIYPHLNVKRYVAEDSYEENLMVSDICFSTLGSAGTAVDIPNLTNVILTVAVDSIQSNIQSLGRLRDLGGDSKMEFHFLTCLDISKHLEYAFRKKEMLSRYAKTYSEIHSRHML